MKHDDHYALVIGIDHYPRYRPLQGAIADARDFERWLRDDRVGGGVPDSNLRVIESNDPPPAPLQLDIGEKLDEIFEAAAAKGGGQRLYLYFGGHGFATKPSDVALCMAAWSKKFRNLAISSLSYRDAIVERGLF